MPFGVNYIIIFYRAAALINTLIVTFGTNGYEEVAMKFFNTVLYKMKDCPDDYVYYHIKAPWNQIKILKIMQLYIFLWI